jgi:hypothetical protein
MAEFKLARFKYTWQGDWAPAGRYNPDDIVGYGGKVYTCLVTHNAAPDFYEDLNFFNNDTPPLAVPRWELIADGVTWQGDWQPDTYYKVGDIIKQSGTVYICVEGHTSATIYYPDPFDPAHPLIINPTDPTGVIGFFNNDVDLNQYWTVHLTSKNWRVNWTPNTYYTLNDVVRAGGRTYRCNRSHTSASSFEGGLESNILSWDIVNIADDWKGNWQKDTKYIVNDIVKDGGIVYRCVAAHHSALSDSAGLAADLDLGDSTLTKWEILHESTQYRDTWVSSTPVVFEGLVTNVATIYKVNDVVKYGSYVWKCNTFHVAGLVFDQTKFDIFCPGEEFDADWSPTTFYQVGDIVFYGGDVFVSKAGHSNANPSTNTTIWSLLFQSSNIRGTWNSLRPYKIGDVVRKGGNVYLALSDNTSQDPDIPNDGSSTNSGYWDLVVSGIAWKGIWTLGNAYATGDVVSWGETSYRCIDAHEATALNAPFDDANGFTWTPIVVGNSYARLKQVGDIKTYGTTSSSTLDTKRLAIGTEGNVARVNSYGEVEWRNVWSSAKVYYVGLTGVDDPAYGLTQQKPWRTLRYALDNVTGYATIFVRTGVYEEILPLRVPAFVAVVGDELRSTVIKPAEQVFTDVYLNLLIGGFTYLKDLIKFIIREEPIGTTDPLNPAFGTVVYGEIAQDVSGTAATTAEALTVEGLLETFITRISTRGGSVSIAGSNTITTSTNMLNARQQILNNKAFLKNEITLYVENVFTDSTVTNLPANWSVDLDRGIDAITYDIYRAGNFKTIGAADYFVYGNLPAVNKRSNMFLLRDGTGLRNMSLIGLSGTLGAISSYGTRRPNAGAFASLDPGWGPSDTTAWVGTRSPYVQNVSTFGDGCIGMKVDGDLHGGGNQTIVANDLHRLSVTVLVCGVTEQAVQN